MHNLIFVAKLLKLTSRKKRSLQTILSTKYHVNLTNGKREQVFFRRWPREIYICVRLIEMTNRHLRQIVPFTYHIVLPKNNFEKAILSNA